jgi:hypothetical protein
VAWAELGFSPRESGIQKRAGRTPAVARARRDRAVAVPPAASGWTAYAPNQHPMARFMAAVGARGVNAHRVMHGYYHRGWIDDEAAGWASAGIDAGDATAWKELGLRPAEAKRLAEAGQTPMGTARAWTEAGIPFAEIATWLGAGLAPAEAAAQRAKGISAERAGVLRALRDDD